MGLLIGVLTHELPAGISQVGSIGSGLLRCWNPHVEFRDLCDQFPVIFMGVTALAKNN